MNADCLGFILTDAERQQFNSQGYLIVENALDSVQIAQYAAAVDRIDAANRTAQHGTDKLLSVTDILYRDDAFLRLIDWPRTFPKVWGILGWNIYLYHSHVDVSPPANPETATWNVAWHQDSMRVNDEIECQPRPRLSLKVGFYLTDVSQPNRGNTLIVPGSHLDDDLACPRDGLSNPQGTEPLCLEPGSAVLLDRRLWHSRSLNTSNLTRKVIWLGYSYRWLKPKDAMSVKHLYPRLSPIQRQILGDGQSANGVYDPTDADVPLFAWLREHRPEEAGPSPHGRVQSRPPAMIRGHNSGRQ